MNGLRGAMRILLQLEGLALAGFALALVWSDLPQWWVIVAVLVLPDLAILGYLAGNKIGAAIYNAAHSTIGAFAVFGLGMALDNSLVEACAGLWLVHIGVDRTVGYGLKYASGFKNTHLSGPG